MKAIRNYFKKGKIYSQINELIIDTNINKEIEAKLKYTESKGIIYDYQSAIYSIFSPKKETKSNNSNINNNPISTSTSGAVSNFFNEYSHNLVNRCSNDTILSISTKAFAGSTDIPKDIPLSIQLLSHRLSTIKEIENNDSNKELEFYLKYFISQINKTHKQSNLINEISPLSNLSNLSYYKEKYCYARDFLKILVLSEESKEININLNKIKLTKDKLNQIYKELYNIFKEVSHSIYEAHYYIGLIHKKGLLNGKINLALAYNNFSIAASHFHAISLYEIFLMIKNDDLKCLYYDKETKNKALFHYLQLSAEEGYSTAMYHLGNIYINGEITNKNYYLALSWHRHACRNGYYLSYDICGDLLNNGGYGLEKDKILALSMYSTSYKIIKNQNTLNKMQMIKEELIKSNKFIPEQILNI